MSELWRLVALFAAAAGAAGAVAGIHLLMNPFLTWSELIHGTGIPSGLVPLTVLAFFLPRYVAYPLQGRRDGRSVASFELIAWQCLSVFAVLFTTDITAGFATLAQYVYIAVALAQYGVNALHLRRLIP